MTQFFSILVQSFFSSQKILFLFNSTVPSFFLFHENFVRFLFVSGSSSFDEAEKNNFTKKHKNTKTRFGSKLLSFRFTKKVFFLGVAVATEIITDATPPSSQLLESLEVVVLDGDEVPGLGLLLLDVDLLQVGVSVPGVDLVDAFADVELKKVDSK